MTDETVEIESLALEIGRLGFANRPRLAAKFCLDRESALRNKIDDLMENLARSLDKESTLRQARDQAVVDLEIERSEAREAHEAFVRVKEEKKKLEAENGRLMVLIGKARRYIGEGSPSNMPPIIYAAGLLEEALNPAKGGGE